MNSQEKSQENLQENLQETAEVREVEDNQEQRGEAVFEAVGLISDEKVVRADAPVQIKRLRFMSLQFAGLAAAMLVVAISAVLMLHFWAPENIANPAASETTDDSGVPVSGYWWLVTPDYRQEFIEYCESCDVFFSGGIQARVCERTLQIGGFHDAFSSPACELSVPGEYQSTVGRGARPGAPVVFQTSPGQVGILDFESQEDIVPLDHEFRQILIMTNNTAIVQTVDSKWGIIAFGDYNPADSVCDCELCEPVTPPGYPEMTANLALFLERLEESGLVFSRDYRHYDVYCHVAHTVVGHYLTVYIGDERVTVFDYFTEEYSEQRFSLMQEHPNGDTVFISGTVLVIWEGRAMPDAIMDFLTLHYGTPTVLPCDCHICEAPPRGEESVEDYVKRVAGLDHFTNVNTLDVRSLIGHYIDAYKVCWRFAGTPENERYVTIEFGYESELSPQGGTGQGVTPVQLEAFVREYINPNFRIESTGFRDKTQAEHDFDWVYDAERDLIFHLSVAMCGAMFPYQVHEIMDVTRVGGQYHVTAMRVLQGDRFLLDVDVTRFVVSRNARGNFNIMSMQIADDVDTPDWVSEYFAYREKLENDLALLYEYINNLVDPDSISVCDPEWCDLTIRSRCDGCMRWNVAVVLQVLFRDELRVYLGWCWLDE